MKHKTQVFLSPMGDHYRTRMTHTLEVSEIARTLARAMSLNEDLVEAIALGHDLGHTPFGHGGEIVLKEILGDGFSHQLQSLRVVEVLERRGQGLNLTYEVRDGILRHSKGYGKILPEEPMETACTIEGQVVRVADIMAYLNHDLDDAVRSGVIQESQIPKDCVRLLGRSHSERATAMIRDLIYSSETDGDRIALRMSNDLFGAMTVLREFLYENVYRSPRVHREFLKAKKILLELYHYFLENESFLSRKLKEMEISYEYAEAPGDTKRIVCDLIASMTDRFALELYTEIFFPCPQV